MSLLRLLLLHEYPHFLKSCCSILLLRVMASLLGFTDHPGRGGGGRLWKGLVFCSFACFSKDNLGYARVHTSKRFHFKMLYFVCVRDCSCSWLFVKLFAICIHTIYMPTQHRTTVGAPLSLSLNTERHITPSGGVAMNSAGGRYI